MLQCTLCMHVAAINPTVAMPTHVQTAKSDPEREREREREPRIHAFPVPILRANFSPLNFSPPFLATSAANVALQTASLPRDMGTLRFPQHTLLNHGDGTTGLSEANKSVQLSSFILNLWPWD